MRFNELNAKVAQEDQKWDIDDTRRPRLKLKHINKMRFMREQRKAEHRQEVQDYKSMYSQGSAE